MALTKQQLEERRSGIGGSDAAAILGLSPWKTPLQIWQLKVGLADYEDLADNEFIHFGNILEDVVAQEFSNRTGKKVARINKMTRHPEHRFIIANIDRRIVGENAGLECKTAGAFSATKWGEEGTDDLPVEYLIQCHHYMAVMGWEKTYVAVLIGGNRFKIYVVERDQEMIDKIIDAEVKFWMQHVLPKLPPDPIRLCDVHNTYLKDSGKAISANLQMCNEIAAIQKIDAETKRLETEREAHELKVKEYMGDAAVLTWGDTKLASWKNQGSPFLDSKRLKTYCPDIFEAFYDTTRTTRVFRVSKAKGDA